jgi:PTH1 family peptidyl-tRNA hydrolase
MDNMCLIAGLGNPGSEYARTRHNVGFLLADKLVERWRAEWALEKKFSARVAKAEFAGQRVILCQPQTYMNLSGEAVGALSDFYRIPAAKVLLLVDDADLPFGQIRLRPDGSSGGHHGLESVEQHLATRAYPRLRLGIGRRADGVREITGHVLGQFNAADAGLLGQILDRAVGQVECLLIEGVQSAMNKFNGAVQGSETKEPQ